MAGTVTEPAGQDSYSKQGTITVGRQVQDNSQKDASPPAGHRGTMTGDRSAVTSPPGGPHRRTTLSPPIGHPAVCHGGRIEGAVAVVQALDHQVKAGGTVIAAVQTRNCIRTEAVTGRLGTIQDGRIGNFGASLGPDKRKKLVRQMATTEEVEVCRNPAPVASYAAWHANRGISTESHDNPFPIIIRQKTLGSSCSSCGGSKQSVFQTTGRVTLIRGESCSLVDIPTYLSSPVELAGSRFQLPSLRTLKPPAIQKTKSRPEPLKHPEPIPEKKTQLVCCVAVTMLTMCITLVGTMLSITSEYQDQAIAEKLGRHLIKSSHHINHSLPHILISQDSTNIDRSPDDDDTNFHSLDLFPQSSEKEQAAD